ncbi:MAG: hypothetical protein KAQ92_08995 [Candidatus Aenigmarchaeota archaeon]|nr:hypothetical protein [Candidatus Aenigmarchaeota archaeon]
MDDIKKEFEDVKKLTENIERSQHDRLKHDTSHEEELIQASEQKASKEEETKVNAWENKELNSTSKEELKKEKEEDEKNHSLFFKEDFNYRKEFPEIKLTILWVIGSLFIFIGSWFAGHLRENIGLSVPSYAMIMVISFLFILLGGFMWIAIAVIVCHEDLD